MKKHVLALALGSAALASSLGTQAATTTGNFDVNINLTASCRYTKTADVQFDYTSMQTAAQSQTTAGGFTVQCTNNLPHTISLSSASVVNTEDVTDAAVNLQYTLNLSSPTTSITANGTAQPYSVTGTMPANQPGNCATFTAGGCNNSSSANKQRTITITY
jgi:spore coat protein U-like protein